MGSENTRPGTIHGNNAAYSHRVNSEATVHRRIVMSCLCGFRLWGGKAAVSSPTTHIRDEGGEHPRPSSGSTPIAASSTADIAPVEKERTVSSDESRSRSRSVSQRLAVPVRALTVAMRDRARSKSRSKSLLPSPTPPEDDEKSVPCLPLSNNGQPPQLSIDLDRTPRQSKSGEETSHKDIDGEKAMQWDVNPLTDAQSAWPEKDEDNRDKTSSVGNCLGVSQRSSSNNSVVSLETHTTVSDTQTPPDFAYDEKKLLSTTQSTSSVDCRTDSKLEDEGVETGAGVRAEMPEQRRKRKMRESRQQLSLMQPKEEQDRLDMFQCM